MIGTRGHDLGGFMSAGTLAKKAKDRGLGSIQLVTYRSIEGVEAKAGFMSHGFAQQINRVFQNENVRIALLGCYINVPHDNLELFKEFLSYGKDFGCHIVGTETGSVNSDYSFNPENHGEEALKQVIDKFSEMVRYGEKFGVFVGVEGVHSHIIHTPERMLQLLNGVDSPNLKVIFDPVNLITPENYLRRKEIIEQAFELYGDRIVIIHGKDFIIKNNELVMVPLGRGLMDYHHLYEVISHHKYDLDVIIEDYQGKELEDSIEFLKSVEGRC